jgi:hypothetical protein
MRDNNLKVLNKWQLFKAKKHDVIAKYINVRRQQESMKKMFIVYIMHKVLTEAYKRTKKNV